LALVDAAEDVAVAEADEVTGVAETANEVAAAVDEDDEEAIVTVTSKCGNP